jgi:regulator of cell morphogenesis and NO signaling
MENTDLLEQKIADIVALNIKTAHVFKKYGIDFCCGGGITIQKACEKKNIDINSIMQDLKNIDEKVIQSQNYNNWEIDFLADFIVNTHHVYVTESLGLIDAYATKVAKVHGGHHPAVIKIKELFELVAQDLTSHMKKEELILFPYIKKLAAANKSNLTIDKAQFGSVNNPINMMEEEHETVGNLFKEIAVLSNNYTPPAWACNTFKALYAKLDEFEQDLHIHIHLENNILFPKAIEMESKFVN